MDVTVVSDGLTRPSWLETELFLMEKNKVRVGRPENIVRAGTYFYASTVLENQIASPLSFETYFSQCPFLIFALLNLSELPLEVSLICVDSLCASIAAESTYYRTIFAMLRGNHIPLCFPGTAETSFSQLDMVLALQLLLFCDQDLTERDAYRQLVHKSNLIGFEDATGATKAVYCQLRAQPYSKCLLMELLVSLVERLPAFDDLCTCNCIHFTATGISHNMGSNRKELAELRYFALVPSAIRLFDKKFTLKMTQSLRRLMRWSCEPGVGLFFDLGDYGGQPHVIVDERDPAKLRVMEVAIDFTVQTLLEMNDGWIDDDVEDVDVPL